MLTAPKPAPALEWECSPAPVLYPDAMARMEARATAISSGQATELAWLLEHPPLYTAGSSSKEQDLLDGARFPVYRTGRGGQYTYHGPGQRVGYVMLDLKRRAAPEEPDIRRFVEQMEAWLIRTLAQFGVKGFIREGRIGVWVETPAGEAKIGALGIHVRRWVTTHGMCLNVNPDLSHYAGIVPCGLRGYGVTSLHTLGVKASMAEVDAALQSTFAEVFEADK